MQDLGVFNAIAPYNFLSIIKNVACKQMTLINPKGYQLLLQ